MILTDLLSRGLAVVAATPLIGLLLKLFLIKANDGVLADADIALFLLHPIGMAALMIVGAVFLGVLFAEQSVLMVIGFGAVDDRRVTWLDAVHYVGSHAVELVKLAGQLIFRLLIIASPFLAGIGGVYLLFLTAHDINFYLVGTPPEWWWAVSLAGLLLVILAIIVLRALAGWILVLPFILFEGKRAKEALSESVRKTAPRRWEITLLFVLWLAAFALLSVLITFLVSLLGDLLIPDFTRNLAMVAVGLAVTMLLAVIGNLGLAIVGTILFALLIVRLYHSMAGPGQCDPELAARGSLGDRAPLILPGKAIIGLGAAALILILAVGYFTARSLDAEKQIEIIAHRGASGAAPENTMAAFQQAIVEKADWIELDVQENAEDAVVVAHDSDFMKVARNSLKVWEATSEDLRDLDIGSWYGPEFSDQRVPTLHQVLELAKDKLGVVIELKYYGHNRELESRVVEVVEQTGMESNVKIMSLKLDGVRKAAQLRPGWPCGLLNTASIGDLTRLDLDFLALNSVAATRSMISHAHKRGMKVYVWTINDPIQMSVIMSRGADGIITDEPALARQVMGLRNQLSPIGRLLIWIGGETGLLRDVDQVSSTEDA